MASRSLFRFSHQPQIDTRGEISKPHKGNGNPVLSDLLKFQRILLYVWIKHFSGEPSCNCVDKLRMTWSNEHGIYGNSEIGSETKVRKFVWRGNRSSERSEGGKHKIIMSGEPGLTEVGVLILESWGVIYRAPGIKRQATMTEGNSEGWSCDASSCRPHYFEDTGAG